VFDQRAVGEREISPLPPNRRTLAADPDAFANAAGEIPDAES
jgi:hypothetical protein